ncbi:MAG: DUF885 family protein, partial [Cystobacter sp.]
MDSRKAAGLLLLLMGSPATAWARTDKPAWVERSDANARLVLETLARFTPEEASSLGMAEQDEQTLDLAPGLVERTRAAMNQTRATLQTRLDAEKDANVRQDLRILVGALDEQLEDATLQERYLLHWVDAPQVMFLGLRELLQDDMPPERRAHALPRLRRYVGLEPGSTPLTQLAHARFEEGLARPERLGPVKRALEQSTIKSPTYVKGIRELFAQYKLEGAEPALAALEKQVEEDTRWRRSVVLPRAREDARLPPELYAFHLKQVGIDVPPEQLVSRARVAFMEIRAQMEALAPLVARAKGLPVTDAPGVLRALKKEQLGRGRLQAHYQKVTGELEKAIRKHRVVELPARPLVLRLASEAESAAHPAPYMQLPDFVGEDGRPGQFVLSLGEGKSGASDDFSFGAAA